VKNSCFIAPIHEPKFDYALELIKSYNTHFDDDHFFFVFSSIDEESKFRNITGNLRYRSIIYDGVINSGIITLKKYHGLNHVFSTTDFKNVAVIDVDCQFIRNVDYDAMFQQHNDSTVLYGNKAVFVQQIIDSPNKFFSKDDVDVIRSVTNNLYFWFNDIPIYQKESFVEFMDYINYSDTYESIKWEDFDYIIYGYYLLLKGYAKLIKIDFTTGLSVIEEQDKIPSDKFVKIFNSYDPMWIKNPINNMKNVFIILHVDR
jgi:hypothetical protein